MWEIPIITPFLGYLLKILFYVFRNYGWSLIFFTIITRALMLPFSIKQQKNTANMARMKPKMDVINKKYANNKAKQNEEMMKLYKEENYNPAAGCLPLLIQMPLLFGLIGAVYRPLKYIMGMSDTVITAVRDAAGIAANNNYGEIFAIKNVAGAVSGENAEVLNSVKDAITAVEPEQASQIYANLTEFSGKFNFLGLDLLGNPNLPWSDNSWLTFLWLIPLLSGATAFLSSFISTRINKQVQSQQPGGAMSAMLYVMPLFSLYIAFVVPAGVGFYWLVSNVIMIAQTLLLNKFYNPKKILEQIAAEEALKPKGAKKAEKEEDRKRLSEAREKDMSDFDE